MMVKCAMMVKRDLVPRIARWWMLLQNYDMEIEYRPNSMMAHVDALSRNPVAINMVGITEEDWSLTVQLQDDKAQAIVSALATLVADKSIKDSFKMNDGRLYRKMVNGDKLYVPSMARFNLVKMHHDDVGHPGSTGAKIRTKVCWCVPELRLRKGRLWEKWWEITSDRESNGTIS